MTFAESIARQSLIEEEATLERLKAGTEPIAPWMQGKEQETIGECEARIASIKEKLSDTDKLDAWWDSIPLETREGWYNNGGI